MRLYSTEPEFHIPEELQQQIQEVKEMYRKLTHHNRRKEVVRMK